MQVGTPDLCMGSGSQHCKLNAALSSSLFEAALSACCPHACLQPHGLSCAENVIKECEEEASIPVELAQRARPVGAVSYTSLQASSLLSRGILAAWACLASFVARLAC